MTKVQDESKFSEEFLREVYISIFGKEPPDTWFEETDYRSLAELFEIENLETDLGLPKGFFLELLNEDDWSFIIKLHALIEASFTHLLVQHFNQPSLEKIFSLLALSDLRTGKLAFAKSLELVDTDIECFVRKMSEMRNAFVHNVTNVNIHIKDFLAGFDKNKRKEYKTGFLFGYKDKQNIQLRQNKDTYDVKRIIQLFSVATFDEVPKLSIWFGSLVCLRQIYSHVILAQIRVQKQDLNEQITTLLENAIVTPQLLEEDDHQED